MIIVASVSASSASARRRPTTTTCQVLRQGRLRRPRRAAAQARLDPVHAQRHGARARHVPRARRDARGLPGLRRDRLPRDAVRRRGRAPAALRPAHRRADRGRPRARRDLARDALQRPRGDDRGARSRRSARELNARCAELEAEGKLLESHRLRQRTQYDMEMLREIGFCNGIENYSRILDGRRPGDRPVLPDRLLPRRLRLLHRRVAPDRAADRRHVRGRPLAQADARRLRLPAAERAGQPPADVRRVPARSRRRWSSSRRRPGDYERSHSARDRRADRAPDRHRRPARRGARDAQPDRRPHERGPRARRPRRARAGHHAHEEDERGPHRLPARDGLQGPLPALGDRHARAHPDHPRPAPGRVRRARRRQPPARGARPAGGLAGGDPRRRQGGLPARGDVADPDDRARRAQRRRHGAHVRRQGDRGDARRDRRDRAPARDPARLQRGARDHRGDDRQGHQRHRGVPPAGGQDAAAAGGARSASASRRRT